MDIMIINGMTGRSTFYKPSELIKDARAAVKGRGKLTGYFVQVQDGAPHGATVCLVATYQQANGMSGNVTVAI